MAKNNLGQWAEQKAVKLLMAQNYEIVQINYFSRFGEIDIIAKTAQELVFVEVKARTPTQMGQAFEVVTLSKQRKMVKTAMK